MKGNALIRDGWGWGVGEWANRQSYMETCWLHTCCFRPATKAPPDLSLCQSIRTRLVSGNQCHQPSLGVSKLLKHHCCNPNDRNITAPLCIRPLVVLGPCYIWMYSVSGSRCWLSSRLMRFTVIRSADEALGLCGCGGPLISCSLAAVAAAAPVTSY